MRLKVLVLALVLAVSFSGVFMPAAKAEGPSVTPYADVMFWFGYNYADKYASHSQNKDGEARALTENVMGMMPQGDLGVRGAAGNVSVNFAIMSKSPGAGLFGGDNTKGNKYDADQPYMFISVAMVNFGSTLLTVGRFFTPYDIVTFNDVACPDLVFGWYNMLDFALFDATRDQIRINVSGFYVGLFRNNYDNDADYDVMLPMISAGYEFGNPGTPMNFGVYGLFQTVKDATQTTGTATFGKSINSYAVNGKFGMNMAPVTFYVTASYGINQNNMGVGGGAADVKATGDGYANTSTLMSHAGFDYTSGMFVFGLSVGYSTVSHDSSAYAPGADNKADQAMAVAAKVKISPMPNFAITPALRYKDNMKGVTGNKEGKDIAFGVMFEGHI